MPVLPLLEHERQFKIKGLFAIFRDRQFTCKALLGTNRIVPGSTLPVELTLDNSRCAFPITGVRVSLARSVVVPKHEVKKKYKIVDEEIVFGTSAALPGNRR